MEGKELGAGEGQLGTGRSEGRGDTGTGRGGVRLGAADGPQAGEMRRDLPGTSAEGAEARIRVNLSGL